jgi:hypothetical protein
VRHAHGGTDAELAGLVVLEGLDDDLAPGSVSGSPSTSRTSAPNAVPSSWMAWLAGRGAAAPLMERFWSQLMWSGSGAAVGPELSETFLNSPGRFRRDLRILCFSSSVHCAGRPWGSRGRRFKSCRPDGAMGGSLHNREPSISLSISGNARY